MVYRFDEFELDTDKAELRRDREPISVEPQVFSLLSHLVAHRERLVSKNEIVDVVWEGRAVSDSAITSRIKSARQALGDTGKAQRFIRTIHGSGFRFVMSVDEYPAVGAEPEIDGREATGDAAPSVAEAARPSIAVLPFRLVGIAGPYAAIAEALPHELIAELSRLRWLFVIARGSSFRFRSAEPDTRRIGEALNVRYCLSGTVEVVGDDMNITVELADTRDGGVLWGERYAAHFGDLNEIRARIIASVVAALEVQIPSHEARLARFRTPESLDAWASYHLGLHHMFRFTSTDNATATTHFERAIAMEPDFARAHAGLSCTRFQDAFLAYKKDIRAAVDDARRFAERSIELDALDPFGNFAMGRTFWLRGDPDASLPWLERSTALSPNYAQGVYARGWATTISGRGDEGQRHTDLAMALSPLDPLYYAMLGTRALSHIVRGEYASAADWAERAARAPGAHVLVGVIAVMAHTLAGDDEKAASWVREVRKGRRGLRRADFFNSFPFADPSTRERMSAALAKHGF